MESLDKAKAYRIVGYSAVSFSVIALLSIALTLPAVYNYGSQIRRATMKDLRVCKVGSTPFPSFTVAISSGSGEYRVQRCLLHPRYAISQSHCSSIWIRCPRGDNPRIYPSLCPCFFQLPRISSRRIWVRLLQWVLCARTCRPQRSPRQTWYVSAPNFLIFNLPFDMSLF